MNTKERVKNLFSYLLSIRSMDEDVIRNVNQYEKLYWQSNLLDKYKNCIINDDTKEEWFEINKSNKELYDEFFQLFLLLEKNSDNLEIIWGNHILSWYIDGKKIIHPILTTRMELSFNAEKGKFTLKPVNHNTLMELEILSGIEIPNAQKILKVKEEFVARQEQYTSKDEASIAFNPRNIDDLEDMLNKIAHYLSSDVNPEGEIQKQLCSIGDIKCTKYPVFYNAPVIIVRKKDKRLWHNELTNIIKAINEGYPIPATIETLITDKPVDMSEETIKQWKGVGENLLFPLPANEEQKEVVKKLVDNFGLVVQGPPGTGKSHTIANLICQLLAHGKRVLVTSQTGRALRVLSDKIPEEIRPLCISILGDDTRSFKELDESVRKITENLIINPEELNREVSILKEQLDYCRNKQKELYEQLKDAERIENKKLNHKGKFYKLTEIAKWVKEHEENCSWVEDNINHELDCPLTEQQFISMMYKLSLASSSDIKKIGNIKSVLRELPTSDELCLMLDSYESLGKEYSSLEENIVGWSIPYDEKKDYSEVVELLDKAEKQMEQIENSWLGNIMDCYYSSEIVRPVIKHLYMRAKNYIEDIADMQRRLTVHKIVVPDNVDIYKFKKDFEIIYDTIKKKHKLGKMFKMVHNESEYILNGCLVDGESIKSREQSEVIKIYVDKTLLENELKSLWNLTTKEYGAEEIKELDVNTIVRLEHDVKTLGTIIDWNINYKAKIINTFGEIAFFNKIDWYCKGTYGYLRKGITSIEHINEYKKCAAYIENVRKLANSVSGIEYLAEAVKLKDKEKIKEVYKEIVRLKQLVPVIDEIYVFLNKLRKYAPETADKIVNDENREKYKDITKAWKWKQFNALLQRAHNVRPEIMEKAIEDEKEKERILTKEIVAKQAWYNQIVNTTDLQKRSLYAWMQAVKRIGKGTGKFAGKYRSMAQREMEKCKDSIPVWIMPLNRVIENIKLNSNLFDVVIFDESSQSDIFGLCALFRGKRAVIVGDDKQISPQAVGIDQEIINDLIDRYLTDIPHSEWFDLQTSLYNTALRVFPNRLLLKEHFRCVPEIIGFSNDLCYSGEIIPLRHPKISETFDSPIKAIRVDEGARDKVKQINVNEAEAVVNQIVECCKDKKYAGMTMGVISLLGDAQAEYIENMLRQRLGEREMIKRKLICGDAYSFQGDERDIMFLSMVVANNMRFTALTRETDIRRFNVAASRARNQMWLFYSVDPEKLNSNCVRTKLLRYCMDPTLLRTSKSNEEHVFNSQLQKDVFDTIKSNGYNVKALVKLGRYRVDFVVEGQSSRVAIECDGDRWDGLQGWEQQRERQMALERVGWTIYRIRGSEFYRDPEATMKKLWDKLHELGIEKITA
ncbi:MAG: AAA domain-containing protein [Bacillota bacterium]|nr:AAA domain-containing protein [Bacillota bacterium]